MYVFEAERGIHATVTARWGVPARDLDIQGTEVDLKRSVSVFLRVCGDELEEMLERLSTALEIDVFALEGYYRDGSGHFVVCDIDLPVDRAFMS